ncbi:hypothetical protein TWF703_006653 [Orbilia oligospora]|uniref:Uncharacterized protein n=1 Tax=Orbilia oligospora TaxID=2813651 RepID=A0A7C8P5S0_ORBOL|nr:hypothetical protein TWF703_006653 [Orbilia oligospora]
MSGQNEGNGGPTPGPSGAAGSNASPLISESVTKIQGLNLLEDTRGLESEMAWIAELQEDNERLYGENYDLEKRLHDVTKELNSDTTKVTSENMAKLYVDLEQAHIIIKGMRTKYTTLKTTSTGKSDKWKDAIANLRKAYAEGKPAPELPPELSRAGKQSPTEQPLPTAEPPTA